MEFQSEKNKNLKEAVVKTIAFFDMFDYPLTAFQVWKYLGVKCEFNEFIKVLENGSIASGADEPQWDLKNGFYFLKEKKEIITTRKKRYNYTFKKIKRAILIAKIFKFIPWIKMIAVGNNIGEMNLKKESDIDLLIITEPGRIWLTRFFTIVITKILGLRPRQNKNKDKICLSFFVDEDSLDMKDLMIKNENIPDFYFIYWLTGLIPVYGKRAYHKLINKNSWIYRELPNWHRSDINYLYNAGKELSWFYYDTVDMLIGGLENNAKSFQMRALPEDLKRAMNKNTNVVVNDHVLKFHSNDRREGYMKKYEQKLIEINRRLNF